MLEGFYYSRELLWTILMSDLWVLSTESRAKQLIILTNIFVAIWTALFPMLGYQKKKKDFAQYSAVRTL